MTFARVFQGSLFTAADAHTVTFHRQALLCLDEAGVIARIIPTTATDYSTVRQAAQNHERLVVLAPNTYLLPGFIDLHVHAPQWPQAGLALDRPLADWLNTYTFPLEAKYADTGYAQRVYQHLVAELLANGTTTAQYFGTIHHAANLVLAQQCVRLGQRGYVGQVVMDNPDQTPATYRSATATLTADTERFILAVQKLAQSSRTTLVPVITPRFIPSCTPRALTLLGQLAHRYALPIQTHCSESVWEDQYVPAHFNGQRDTEVLERAGLLTAKTVVAHGTQLTAPDFARLHRTQAAVAHCPISNAYFGNAVFPVQAALDHQVTVGLGSDISGGFTPSLYRNIQQAVMASQMLQDGTTPTQPTGRAASRISAKTAFYLATKGGAQSLHLKAGQLAPGYLADFQVVHDRYATVMPTDSDSVFERLIYQTTPAEIQEVYVGGRLVHHR
ncbi:amidohydrolase family protein [Levilactobacillus spicheri]|uniref:Guanine deaminase n=2 Tax=Levilactobacillus spicheri TaxID=216463 RepID=A0ABQ0WL51_9LACO|nr:amidohydrolase family protein [Levilactobacillus spicheri]KRL49202.1 cytosine deaminase-like protein [Levilactobacillus spicheri DSM 15429]GEO65628.1 guanine deaminase [Levilactobacillus spicheri]